MAIQTVKVLIDGSEHELTYNGENQSYESTLNAPATSSYNEEGHYYNVSVSAYDDAGNSSTVDANTEGAIGEALRLIVHEKVKPTITIISPGADAYLSSAQPDISIQLRDDDSGINIDSFTLKIDGQESLNSSSSGMTATPTEGGYDITYKMPTPLQDGQHNISVNVSDNDGNIADEATRSFSTDTVAPTLNLTNPPDNFTTNNPDIDVSGDTNDVTSGPVAVVIKVNEVDQGEVIVEESGTFTKSVHLTTEGSNTITVTATDLAGKTTTVTRTVILKTTAPKITSVEIVPNPVDAGQTFIIRVKVSE